MTSKISRKEFLKYLGSLLFSWSAFRFGENAQKKLMSQKNSGRKEAKYYKTIDRLAG